jgi:hypothetical protein
VSDLAAIDPAHGLAPLFEAWRERRSFDLAMRRAFAVTATDFEAQWHQRTRWSFAFLAVAVDSAIGSLVLVVLLAPLYQSRRRAQRARLEDLQRREAITDRTNQSAALDALMRSLDPAPPASGPDA